MVVVGRTITVTEPCAVPSFPSETLRVSWKLVAAVTCGAVQVVLALEASLKAPAGEAGVWVQA